MGIVKQPQSSREFVVPNETPYSTYQAHIQRYAVASRFVKDKEVLDVACGTGYGSAYLAERAARVTGVDISPSVIGYARASYTKQRLSFVRADATSLPFSRGSFDVVVSFETIEHLTDHGKFLSECQSLLRSGGLFVCSTPNKRVFSPYYKKPLNPFHVKEFLPQEFDNLLCEYFADVSLYGQRKINLLQWRPAQIISRLLSAIPGGEPARGLLWKAYMRRGGQPARLEKEIKEETLNDKFEIFSFEYDALHAPAYLVAICRKR